ncbi:MULTISPECIES: vWA domain-containing protein [Thermomonospora]|uniref:VWA containing CoxE family protein n=1 Tax=Thermomonospora curvata (strain ATCC 19995 / DSM 43183 / JCM 3096 / KCTC 9072 / NBRC 15933 / NCIMB 10081 / Henssen B9) TaxID=471852 RepID=D1A1Q8_THECD|nr:MULTISPECIES: VWA domain-containing protein [Thermomonospora]ACY97746.1 VWA containing CoxE family protein [Thermomonospora curvata DSM 43183]PKK14044.1 MAG: VWA domain-containing protein [Thermomonospora sp. CIF 1]
MASLVDRHTGFVAALREAGLPVSVSEGLDAVRALTVIDLIDREALRAAYAATLVKRPAHRKTFDTLFDLWFPAALGDGVAAARRPAPAAEAGADRAAPLPPPLDPEVQRYRQELFELLLNGDDVSLAQFARAAVARFGRSPGQQSWFSSGVLRALSPQTLMAGLLNAVLAGRERGGMAEQVARQTFRERIGRFESLVATEVRRRIAEDGGVERAARMAVRPPLEQLDFNRATRADLAALRRQVYPLARRLATRLAQRQRLADRGRLDFRRTVRASLSTGGVPLTTHHRPRRPHRPELVILCDASDSVAAFAHFTLLLTFALREQFTKVRAFAFIDTTDEITRFFTPGADVVDAMTAMVKEADLVWITGRSNYGNAIKVFAEKYGDAITPRTSLLILGDARSNYGPLSLPILRRLVDQARNAYWLNPEPRRNWDTGDSAASAYGEIVPMHECRNLTQLAQFIEELAG